MSRLRSDSGAAIVWALALSTVVMIGGQLSLTMAQLTMARQQVATAADLSALAGAQAVGDPCGRARLVAEANGASLSSCISDGVDVIVIAQAPAPSMVARLLAVVGRDHLTLQSVSRAGQPGI